MKQPLYALLFAPNPKMRKAIVYSIKKISIREGYRDYRAGNKVMLCCHLDPWAVMADIVEVRHTALWYVTQEEWKLDGYDSQAGMWYGLKKFYPAITMGSPVTVIRWDNVSGALVENAEREKLLRKHYPQHCLCENFERGLVANDCHVHNINPRHFVEDEDLDCDCHIWKNAKATCDLCKNLAAWVRRT